MRIAKLTLIIASLFTGSLAVTGQNHFPTDGNVGIGTTSPIRQLQIRKDHNSSTTLYLENHSSGNSALTQLSLLGYQVGLDIGMFGLGNTNTFIEGLPRSKTVFFRTHGGAFANRILFGTGSPNPIHFITNDITRLFISGTGKVGIGNTDPLSVTSLKKL